MHVSLKPYGGEGVPSNYGGQFLVHALVGLTGYEYRKLIHSLEFQQYTLLQAHTMHLLGTCVCNILRISAL